ncbi:MAG: Mur ligase family protein, partial [Planctomycetota bacterium]|nr:Mur ligase family protein [Planctomycetota bacterium]
NEPAAMDPQSQCVIEISSYQLEALGPALAKVRAAGLTALGPDHLERHGDLQEYLRCKARIFDWLPPGAPALLPQEWWDREPFVGLRSARPELDWRPYGPDQELGIRKGRFALGDKDFGATGDFHVPGNFQRQNLLLALGLADGLHVPADHLAVRLPHVTGAPHRLQALPPGPGPQIFDNGVSTTPETTLAAVQSLPKPLVVLIGGKAKAGLPYPELARACADRGDRVHLFGAASSDLQEAFSVLGQNLICQENFEDAIQSAWNDCLSGQTLLFSPACASFDAFPNFQARARLFLERIQALRGS